MSCPVCSSSHARRLWSVRDRLFRTTDRSFELRRCGGCDLVYLWPQPTSEELQRYYPEGYWAGPASGRGAGLRARVTEAYRRFVLRDHLRFVGRVVKEQRRRGVPVRLLDVGTGDGAFLDTLGCRPCVGMDLSPSAMRAARARNLEGVRGELHPPPFRTGSFSLVTMFHFLEHLASPDSALSAVRELLRRDGDLVVQVPNLRSWQARLAGPRWMGYDVPRHLVNYSDCTLRATLERSGFEVVHETHFSLRDNANSLVGSLLPVLFPPARAARRVAHRGLLGWLGDACFLALAMAVLPFTLLESGFGHGAAVMVQAQPRDG